MSSKKNYILGLSYGYHDSAATLLCNGQVVAAAQEERFSRIKQDCAFPSRAILYCLQEANIGLEDIACFYYYENPEKKFDRIYQTYLHFGIKGFKSFIEEMPSWFFNKRHVKKNLQHDLEMLAPNLQQTFKIECIDHHQSHAAAAFFPSPFESAAVLCIDGVGEWATTSAWHGNKHHLDPIWEIHFPHSLGLLYSAMTYFCGFKVDSGEYKLMGLAPYGQPNHVDTIRKHLIEVKEDGSFWLNMDYFDYAIGHSMINDRFCQLFGGPKREPEGPITQREFNLAASIQVVIEDCLIRLATTLRQQTGLKNLCMAGGVALNCVANGKLLKSKVFDNIWIQPAAGDAGGSLGAALAGWHLQEKQPRIVLPSDSMNASLLGPSYSENEINQTLNRLGAVYNRLDNSDLYPTVAQLLATGHVIGWFQGRMEFGPRALGSRSILGDARNSTMQTTMNLKIKNRESFRPFAPMVLEEHAQEWFQMNEKSPYMLFVTQISNSKSNPLTQEQHALTGLDKLKCSRSAIPAVTHVDYSARLQTVGKNNIDLRRLLEEFYAQTGCPVLVNTSFNVRGEPIVESPENAYTCFMRTNMDYLVIGNHIMKKNEQPIWQEKIDWQKEFALD